MPNLTVAVTKPLGAVMRHAALPLAVAAIALLMGAEPAKQVHPTGIHGAVVLNHTTNPHLHGVQTHEVVTHHTSLTPNHTTIITRQHVTVGWNPHAWIVLHRGLGTIHGVITTAGGQAHPAVLTGLRRANGHQLRNHALRHMIRTDGSGQFVMHNVRPGRYRVLAPWTGRHHSHVNIAVHSGELVEVRMKV